MTPNARTPTASVRSWRFISLHLEDDLDLDGNVDGQPGHADGRAGVLADRLAEHFHHQVGEAVDHLRLLAEAVGRVDHAEHLHHALDLVEAPQRRAGGGEQVEADLARRLVALLHGELAADLAGQRRLAVGAHRAVAGEIEQVAGANGADGVGARRGRRRQREVLLLERGLGAHRASFFGRGPGMAPKRSERRGGAATLLDRTLYRADNGASIVTHYAVAVKPPPAIPSPAATLVLLRDRPGGGVECLLMRRHLKSKFAAGDFVFPGGKIEADDNPEDAVRWCRGLDVKDAARRLDLEAAPRTALGFWIGAIRET